MKKLSIAAFCLLAALITACSEDRTAPATTTPSPVATVVATPTPPPAPTVVKTESKTRSDGSEVVTTQYSDNSKREVRTFKKGPLVSVERRTSADGTVTARVVRRSDNSETEVTDKGFVDKSMDATGEALSTAASKTKDVGEKVGETTKEGAKAAGSTVKEGAEKAGSEATKGAKAAGSAVKEGAEKTGSAAEKGAKEAGEGTKKAVKKVIP